VFRGIRPSNGRSIRNAPDPRQDGPGAATAARGSRARAVALLATLVLAGPGPAAGAGVRVRGVDLSGLEEVERHGGRFSHDGEAGDAVEILAGRGANFVRLSLGLEASEGLGDLDSVARVARRAREHGLGFLLALHYSDRRADASRQHTPAAWAGLSFDELKVEVFRWTHDVITRLRNENALPDLVQIGNEITNGMLWNRGRVGGRFDSDEQWTRLAELLLAAELGLEAALLEGESMKTVIHVDPGVDPRRCLLLLERLATLGVEFDVIGLSFFPWWHGGLDRLEWTLAELSRRWDRDILVVETAFPWTLRWLDRTQNEVGTMTELPSGHEPTPTGQRLFLEDVAAVVAATPGGRGLGFFYWAPERITAPGLGSRWENLALFGADGGMLPAARVLGPPIED